MAVSDIKNRFGGTSNDAVAANIMAAKRRRIWKIVIISNIVALIAAITGCLFMVRTQGIQADVAEMRDEVGESLTMMTLGGASEAVARHIPRLIDTTERWNRKFDSKRESFRGLDVEINHVQAMSRLTKTAERWRKELENISPMQRNDLWLKSLKSQVESEQKKWPHRVHKKGFGEWAWDFGKEFWFGLNHGALWPVGIYERTAELIKGGRGIESLEIEERLHYIMFPYRLSNFTILRLMGITLATSLLGYLMCYLGLKTRLGGLSYIGLIYFLYLLLIAIFIVYLEVME